MLLLLRLQKTRLDDENNTKRQALHMAATPAIIATGGHSTNQTLLVFGPPQISLWLPEHVMLQSPFVAWPWLPKLFPQKQPVPPYCTPKYLKLLHAALHPSRVRPH